QATDLHIMSPEEDIGGPARSAFVFSGPAKSLVPLSDALPRTALSLAARAWRGSIPALLPHNQQINHLATASV
ncbi:hypothetical protein Q4485_17710, partial [Granulosicoccaceae sp. 1_MG-2023]|nr:hypothetical protein [Granulosicoccaceae sp. 1_MG-2023]